MKRIFWSIGLVAVFGLLSVSLGFCRMKKDIAMIEQLTDAQAIVDLFPRTPGEIEQRIQDYMAQAKQMLNAIIAIPDEQRTFANTVQSLDYLCGLSNLAIGGGMICALKYVHPNDEVRQAAQDSIQAMSEFLIDNVSNNRELYQKFEAYVEGNAKKEQLTPEQQYSLQEGMKSFERSGLGLPDDELAQLRALKKELADLSLQFSKNMAADQTTIAVAREGLQGLEDDFINNLKRDDAGNYVLGIERPTYMNVIQNCEVEDTRKRLWHAYMNRAYPINEKVLKDIVAKRDELAKILKLGFNSYAEFDLANQMVQTVAHAEQFLHDLLAKIDQKVKQEIDLLIADLPDSVALTKDGKIKPWDSAFLTSSYKKKNLAVDERKIAEYFPMETTIDGLFSICKKFFSLDFQQIPISGVWHDDVKLIAVYNADRSLLNGYVFLDLHPRPNKYSHAAHAGILPATIHNGKRLPAIGLIMANFPKSTEEKPSLLNRADVSTFFHEFGHALHSVLGRTELATQAGTHVKTDFVELPSQMLEQWLKDPEMLKMISQHYKTGESLPDELIDKIMALKTFDTGTFEQRQAMLSLISLDYFGEGADKDLYGIYKDWSFKLQPYLAWDSGNHMYAGWTHPNGYAAKYYGYGWSRMIMHDVFAEIKKHGLLNPEIGQRYVQEIIGKGGSADPNKLLRNFLGRKPNNKAFLRDLGLV